MAKQYTADGEELDWKEPPKYSGSAKVKHIIDIDGGPNAQLAKLDPGTEIEPHFHTQNQWHVILEGSCTIGGEELKPYAVHFTEAESPYGPLIAGEDGLTFLALREKPAGFHPVSEGETDPIE